MKKQMFEINSFNELENIIKSNKGILLIDFTSPACGPCLMLTPVLEKLVDENICSVASINILENQELAREFKISVTPTIAIAKDNKIIESFLGYQPFESWVEIIEKINASHNK